MTLYRLRPPNIHETEQSVFLTWRLSSDGPVCLRQPAVADMIVEAIQYNAHILGHYLLHAFVVMPDHVHLLATPAVALSKLTKSLKGVTANRANAILRLTGRPFWREESDDRLVRHDREFEKIRSFIEGNPVRAGLVTDAGEYRWSSAGWARAARATASAPSPFC